jgi:NAD(P)-dependent dehydrogenase (short-subunit alcohol dehydrogenase family)
MESFAGRLAVVTGGGSGIGRALVRQLAREGASVAIIDLGREPAEETARLALADAPEGVRATAHVANVADEASLEAARDEILAAHGAESINLLFNNAGIAGAGSMIADDRTAWERVFDICWGGVYLGCRVFLPSLIASDAGYIVNTASINAVWPKHGAGMPSTSYGSAKYAVKGFSEALIEDLRTHAPHVRVAVVMPGTVSTNLGENSAKVIGAENFIRSSADSRARLAALGAPAEALDDDQVEAVLARLSPAMTELGYVITVEEAAATILRGVHEGRWRIITGVDANRLDRLVRADPEAAFDDGGTSLTPPWLPTLVTLGVLIDPEAVGAGSFGFAVDADQPVGMRVDEAGAVFTKEPDRDAAATVALDQATLHRLVAREATVAEAIDTGTLRISGDRAAVERLFAALPVDARA